MSQDNSFRDLVEKRQTPPLQIFDDSVVAYISDLSKLLRSNRVASRNPEVMAFSFFCRRANLSSLKAKYARAGVRRRGRGLALHFSPSNVPTNFAYSLVCTLLAGNSSIVKLSSKQSDSATLILEAIDRLGELDRHRAISDRVNFVRYRRDEDITRQLCSICDVRLLWGSDRSVNDIRQYPIGPSAIDITFADRYSFALVDATRYVANQDFSSVARKFYNDTLFFDQNACTSPRVVIWVGDSKAIIRKARDYFWEAFKTESDARYQPPEGNIAVTKELKKCKAVIDGIAKKVSGSGCCNRVELTHFPESLRDYISGGGLFFEYLTNDLKILADLSDRRLQTISYEGFDKTTLFQEIWEAGGHGIDRVVPMGTAADFSAIWDGHDIIAQASRAMVFQ